MVQIEWRFEERLSYDAAIQYKPNASVGMIGMAVERVVHIVTCGLLPLSPAFPGGRGRSADAIARITIVGMR